MSSTRATIAFTLLAVVALALAAGATAAGGDQGSPIVVHVDRGGFRWADAAVGLVAGLGLALATAGCVALLRLRGPRDQPETKGEQA